MLLPLTLLPNLPSYLPHWLKVADKRGLTDLRDRCLSLLARSGTSGGCVSQVRSGQDRGHQVHISRVGRQIKCM